MFVCVLFEDELRAGDLEIVSPASPAEAGVARLGRAEVGAADPAAPASLPLLSSSGGKVGFVANVELMDDGPYNSCYVLS
jgi:hypothetical protein